MLDVRYSSFPLWACDSHSFLVFTPAKGGPLHAGWFCGFGLKYYWNIMSRLPLAVQMLNVYYTLWKAGGALQKFLSASGATLESWPSRFQVSVRISHGHGLSPESSDVSFLTSAKCIYWISIGSKTFQGHMGIKQNQKTRKCLFQTSHSWEEWCGRECV